MRTISDRYVNVKPSANPKPGMTLGFLNLGANPKPGMALGLLDAELVAKLMIPRSCQTRGYCGL
jgi:hypothetical protein